MAATLAQTQSTATRTIQTLLGVLLVALVLFSLALVPAAFAITQADWEMSAMASAARGLLSYNGLTATLTVVNLVLWALYYVAAAILLRQPPRAATLLMALVTMLAPLAFMGELPAGSLPYGEPWAALLVGAANVLSGVAAPAMILLLLMFPDGRLKPHWIVVALLVGGLTLLFVLPDSGDWTWFAFIIGVMATLLAGVVVEAWRFRGATPERRRNSAWFFVAAGLFFGFLILGISEMAPLVARLGQSVFLAILPLGLIAAVRRGVWGEPPAAREIRLAWGAMAVAAVLALAAGLAWQRDNRPVVVDLAALAATNSPPLLLDADMAMDDITALLYLLQHPTADLRAITINGVAFAHCDGGVAAALGLLELVDAPDIPVACGRDEAYPGGQPAPEAWRKNADRLYGAPLRSGDRTADPRPAAELLADTIRAAPGEIVILAVGPLTNLAEAFEADPTLAAQVKEIIIMGGAVDAPGNVSNEAEGISNAFAEWNFFADPVAADIVLRAGAPVTLVPLDATNQVPFTRQFHQQLTQRHDTRPATLVYNLFYLNGFWLDGGMYWWDTLAAAAALDPSLLTYEEEQLAVITDGGPEMARTVRDENGRPVRVAYAADAARFEALLLALLNSGGG